MYLPSTLVKFCDTSYICHFFHKGTIRFSPLKDLNDPYEGQIASDHKVLGKDLQSDDPGHIHRELTEMSRGVNRVFCLADKCTLTSHLMWAHYADSFTGFAVEFDSKKLLDSLTKSFQDFYDSTDSLKLQKVEYRKGIGTGDDRQNFSKPTAWSYEREWRMIITSDKEQVLAFDTKAIRCVYVGGKIKPCFLSELKKVTSEKGLLLREMESHFATDFNICFKSVC